MTDQSEHDESVVVEGLWWVPEQPDDRLYGRLRYGRSIGASLEIVNDRDRPKKNSLAYAVSPATLWNGPSRPLTVHGVTPKGDRFTLFDGFTQNTNFNYSGVSKSECFFNRGLRGACVDRPESLTFSKVTARLDGLEAWLGINPFQFEHGHGRDDGRVAIRHELPPPVEVTIDEQRILRVQWDRTGPRQAITQTEASIRSRPFFTISYTEPVAQEACIEDVAVVEEFLTLLVGQSTSIKDLRLFAIDPDEHGDSRERTVPLEFLAKGTHDTDLSARLQPMEVMIGFSSISENFGGLISRWFTLREQSRSAVLPYFASRHSPALYVEDRFFSHARVAESLHRHLWPKTKNIPDTEYKKIRRSLKEAIPQEYKDLLCPGLNRLHELSYKNRLSAMMAFSPQVTRHVIGSGEAPGEFADLVKKLRNIEAHRLPTDRQGRVSGMQLVKIAAKLQAIIDACLLQWMGLSEEFIVNAMRANRRYWFYASNDTWPWRDD